MIKQLLNSALANHRELQNLCLRHRPIVHLLGTDKARCMSYFTQPRQMINDNYTNMASSNQQFYRKPLPSSCIDFASTEGKNIFKEAMNEGTMDCFFNLAAQFRTQDEPAYCGLSTLVMVLNALSVDPGRIWKGPWRWYHENMLDCCVPLEVVQKDGITFFQFACMAVCNGLEVNMVQASSTASITEFREVVKQVTQSESQVLVCSYSRATLSQAGDGHFSPIGGYHAGRDSVLIFDVARFKYPPHWVTIDLLWKAMQGLDKTTGQPRGYLVMSRTLHTGNPTILFKISNNFSLTLPSKLPREVMDVLQQWQDWLTAPCQDHVERKEFLALLVSRFLNVWCSECTPGLHKIFTIKIDPDCCKDLSEGHKCAICDLLCALDQLPLFQTINESLTSGEHSLAESWSGLSNIEIVNEQLCCMAKDDGKNCPRIKLGHFATMLLLAWPYPSKQPKNQSVCYADFSVEYMAQEMAEAADVLKNEVKLLKSQLSTIFQYRESFVTLDVMSNEAKSCCEGTGCSRE